MANIQLHQGDITRQQVDAIVNAANQRLLGGAGVDGAIHRAGGPEIMAECDRIRQQQGGCPTGEAVITTAGLLAAKYVIHTVGPIWNQGIDNEVKLLKSCYQTSLKLADQHCLGSVAFPNISTGVYGFPKQQAAEVAVTSVSEYFNTADTMIGQVTFVCFDDENYSIYKQLLASQAFICVR